METAKQDEKKAFDEMSFVDQAKSLSTQILIVEKALASHIKLAKAESKNIYDLKEKYILQLERLIKGLS